MMLSNTVKSNVGTRRESHRVYKARRGCYEWAAPRSAGPERCPMANNDNITENTGTPENRPVFPFQDAV